MSDSEPDLAELAATVSGSVVGPGKDWDAARATWNLADTCARLREVKYDPDDLFRANGQA
ncbi:MAG TPA: hypothetical protein VF176_10190 [Solirubrobacterales bacterium]